MAGRPSPRGLGNAILIALLAGILATQAIQAVATHQPADKVAATGSKVEILHKEGSPPELPTDPVEPAGEDPTKVVLEADLKTSTPTDLLIEVSAECALWTLTKTVDRPEDDSRARAEARVTSWVTVDGENAAGVPDPDKGVVPVSGSDDGKVVLCDRVQRLTTQDLEDDDDEEGECPADDPNTEENENAECTFVELFQRTRSANGFNWVAFNLGNGVHTLRLWVQLETDTSTDGPTMDDTTLNRADAAAGIGKRTMLIQPVKFPHHISEVPESGPTP